MEKILLIAFMCLMQFSVQAQYCKCDKEDRKIIFKNNIIICGKPNTQTSESGVILSEIVVADCAKDKYLIDSRLDATQTYAVKKFHDSVTISDMQLIPDATMQQLIFVPLSYQTLFVTGHGEVRLSKDRFAFNTPVISETQKHYLDKLCQQLKSGARMPLTPYPFDETSIYALFMGAVANYNDCYNLFINLDKYYFLDGGILETKKEIPFDYIMEHLKQVKS